MAQEARQEAGRSRITDNLTVLYEDTDVVVYTAPNEDELKEILLDLLRRSGRMTIRELHRHLSGLASEDKIRYALGKLMKDNMVFVDRQGYYYPSEIMEEEPEYFYDAEGYEEFRG